jgi:threonylcarbamoyladenosine tRNA methylthiotransferase MtaB
MSVKSQRGTRTWYQTFGCKANQYDTERMRQELEARGGLAASVPAEADLAVVNTCTVTSEADRDARRAIRRLAREHPGLRIVVAGCSAALREAEYQAMPEVWRVVPGQDPEAVGEAARPLLPLARPPRGGQLVSLRGNGRTHLTRFRRGTRAWIKIQDGCDRRCSFCATRLARGASRSRPPEEIVREATLLACEHPEIVITGIHIGQYGSDLDRPWTLAGLCAQLLDGVEAVRIRLSSIEATEIDDSLVDLMADSGGRLVPHFHVPLQSGSDAVLGRMRRWHTREQYRARLARIVSRLPYLGLGADIITGFPGETDVDHAETRALVEELPYTYLHVFPFSPRSGTPAATLPGRVDGALRAVRARELRELGLAKGRSYRASRLGMAARVVVETTAANGEPVARPTGLTEDYLRVEVVTDGSAGRIQPGAVLDGHLEGDADRLRLRVATGRETPHRR